MVEPFQNRVFIEENGQFFDKWNKAGVDIPEEIHYGIENSEFQAFFTNSGIYFVFAERKTIPKGQRVKLEHEPETRGIETIWHTSQLKFLQANPEPQVEATDKVHEYYNYTGIDGKPNINFVPAFNELVYTDIYLGVNLIFELPEEGGLKYRFELQPNISKPDIAFEWKGAEKLELTENGVLSIKTATTELLDKAPSAETAKNATSVPIKYTLENNVVRLEFEWNDQIMAEGLVIDPWITNTNYPDVNRAFDIQEDAAGNVVVHGNHTNYQVQKFNSVGVLQWTYITNTVFLGDIAVDNPGNVYIIGGYSAGKRQKLDPAGVQQWTFSGLVEEWRLAFNYSKTVLTVGGYFINPGGNNLGRFDTNTGAISNQIIYGLETRSIATDCNGDMYSLHVTFGSSGVAATNTLRKTNADFTPGGSMQSGFLLAEAEPSAGYAPNPGYSPQIFQGFNGLVVSGLYVYMYDGATVTRVNKAALTTINSAAVPGGAKIMCSGLAADLCGNIYAGSQTGIIKFDSLLNYVETINTPGTVYDIIFGANDELLACGAGFLGAFPINCVEPPAINATTSNACDGTGIVTVNTSGGLSPYTYQWSPGGQTTNPITGLSAGWYTYTVNDAFCRTFVDSVQIYQNPTPTFTISGINSSNTVPNSICLTEEVQFSDNSTSGDGNIAAWDWDFGDGNTSSLQSPNHTYTTIGTFDVQLVVTSDYGCMDTIVNQITVDPLPVADFTVGAECLNDQSDFVDATTIASGTVANWQWDFGDSNTSSNQSPSNLYTASGIYPVELIATSANGCSDTLVQNVEVHALPQADFVIPGNCVNDPVTLQDGSLDGDWPINAWSWTAEGNTISGASGQHTFSGPGTFPVQLHVTDQFGCMDSITQDIVVSNRPQIDVSVADDCEDELFTFINNSSIGSGSIDSVHWDMGDGNTSNLTAPTNTYADAGNFNVTFYVESDLGCGDDTTFQVQVFPNPVADLQWTNVCEGASTTLSELSSVASPGQLLPSTWNMGDGTVVPNSTLTSYDYATYGSYDIQLSVETQDGCIDVQTFPVYVHPIPVADFSFTNVCEYDSVLFNDQSAIAQGDITSWQWDFGNGQTSTVQNSPHQTYPADGFYPVTLIATSDSGCVNQLDETVEIYPAPIADFLFDSVCFPLPVQFTDLSNPNGAYAINQWAWQFSDGQTSTSQSPLMSFAAYGAYNGSVIITNAAGCKDEFELGDALVHPLPVADFTANLGHCHEDSLIFSDQSTLNVLSDDQIVSWGYNLGDGATHALPDGTHTYNGAGFYPVVLTVETNHGCVDDVTQQVEVYPLPEVAFEAIPEQGCQPLKVQFLDQSSIDDPYTLSQWQWHLGEPTTQPTTTNAFYTYDPQNLGPMDFETYDVSLVVTSGNGCETTLVYEDMITVHPLPEASFATNPERLATTVNPVFNFTDESTVNVVSWNWQFGDAMTSLEQNPEHFYADTGTYNIRLIVETDFGCRDTMFYTVKVEPLFTFYIPDAFTPNNDGVNDNFFGSGEYLSKYNMKIFNRWGEQIFESNDQDYKWDGSFKGKPVEAGEYVYMFRIGDWDGHDHTYRGSVMLLR